MENKMIKLIEVIKNNNEYPLIIVGVSAKFFGSATIINSDIESSELGIKIGNNGEYVLPSWLKEMNIKSVKNKDKNILVIESIDKISSEEQLKFLGVLKNNGLNGYNFPKNTQIIITCTNVENVSKRIKDLCLIYKVN